MIFKHSASLNLNLLVAHPVQWPTFLHFSYKIVIVIITPVKEGWIKGKLQIFFLVKNFAEKPFWQRFTIPLFSLATFIMCTCAFFILNSRQALLAPPTSSSLLDYNKASSSSSKFQPCFLTNWVLSSFFSSWFALRDLSYFVTIVHLR